MNDERILNLLFSRDESALAEIQAKCGNMLKSVALSIYRNDSVAEECLNDTLMAIWNNIPPDEPESLLSYACTIIRRKAISRVRRETAKKRAIPEAAEYEEAMEDLAFADNIETKVVDKLELTAIMNKFLGKLSSKNRDIFVGRYYYFESLDSLASRMHMSKKTVSARIARMKQNLKEELEKGGFSV